MKIFYWEVPLACLLMAARTTSAAFEHAETESRRLKVSPSESIAEAVQAAHAQGKFRNRFVLEAEIAGAETLFDVNVREAVPAVTSKTTTSIGNGGSRYVNGTDVATVLVSDEAGVLAFIAVEEGGKVNGIVKKGNDNGVKFTQKGKGEKAWANTAEQFTPPAWSCGYGGEQNINAKKGVGRFLFGDDDHHHFDHERSNYDGTNNDHFDHDHSDHFDPSNVEKALADLQHSLRGSELRIGKHRRVQGGAFSYWVDVYVEIDKTLCTDNGEFALCDSGTIGPKTINYVNTLFVGANTIYESEINTHLNVLHINLNINYDNSTSTSTALDTMRAIYARSASVGWHYTSPEGIKPDLHHALLSKNLGGGIAYLGVICDSNYGFGLSASLSGNYVSMGNAVVWDMMVFMHEVGHNFGSGHTHDGYSPVIDTCGTSCPSQLPLAKSSTIMSYCHLCTGDYSNMDYTFGGKYKGIGLRSDSNSYDNSPLAGTVSTEPRRVNANMWTHVSSRGLCTQPYPTGPPTTSAPTPPPTPCVGGMNVEVKVTTDNFPGETSWIVRNECNTLAVMSGGGYSQANTLNTARELCLPPANYTFTIYDSYGDGICCSYGAGSYAIVVDGVTTVTGGQFASVETKTFGTTCAPTTSQPSRSPTTGKPTATPTTRTPSASPTTRKPTASPTTRKPTASPTTRKPTSSPTTRKPTVFPTSKPTTTRPTTRTPTSKPSTPAPTSKPSTSMPSTKPTSGNPSSSPSSSPTGVTSDPVTNAPVTSAPATSAPV